MERQLTSLGLFCSGEGFLIALVSKNSTFEVCSAEKTSDTLVEKIAQVLQKAKVDVSDIECLVVGVGPGSFTGSRVAVSFAKGFSMCSAGMSIKGIASDSSIASKRVVRLVRKSVSRRMKNM